MNLSAFTFGILTISDTCYKKEKKDESGPEIKRLLKNLSVSEDNVVHETVPDDIEEITKMLKYLSDGLKINCVLTTGGTGFSQRDVTPEATRLVITKEAPQFSLAMALESFKKTPFAALSRAVCGIRNNTLIINFPGSKKAVTECFTAIQTVLPHAIELILDKQTNIVQTHKQVQSSGHSHVCPYKTADPLNKNDRNSIYPMIEMDVALDKILSLCNPPSISKQFQSPINYPPFRASIKDGYAIKSSCLNNQRKVIGCISAGDPIITVDFDETECYKINTGAAIPKFADAVVQVEDTKLISTVDGIEKEIELTKIPLANEDIRPIGCDLKKDEILFDSEGFLDVAQKTILASVGLDESSADVKTVKIAVISTGDELMEVGNSLEEGKIYDSNTVMLQSLLENYNFNVTFKRIAKDHKESLKGVIEEAMKSCDVIISSGGVSMGDKDFVKPLLIELDFDILFGRVNMKPGKPMTFGFNKTLGKSFFGLPGNPSSAFVCFHLFVLPALRRLMGYRDAKCKLPEITTIFDMENYVLDSRPEFARAEIHVKNGSFYSTITGEQMSSRIKSLVGADVLLHLPSANKDFKSIARGHKLQAIILNPFFVSRYD